MAGDFVMDSTSVAWSGAVCRCLHANHRHPADVRLAGLRPLMLSMADVFTRTIGILPMFAWRASAR